MARNFGHQTAFTCGILIMLHGDTQLITMDGDMQHPPALIPEASFRLWESGYDVVRTIRSFNAMTLID